ncbi:MAG: non-canonical purine NTP pyrophosphatase [Candidatus Micrarchaeota archaeon]
MLLKKPAIVFVTTNKGKAAEVRRIMRKTRVSVKPLELVEKKHLTHEELARAKAKDAFRKLGIPVVVEDTGLFVEGFKNYPGLRSRNVVENLGMGGFAKKCGGRKAFFRTIAAYCDGRRVMLFKGVCRGEIAEKPSRKSIAHLPYLRVFIPNGFSKPVAGFSKRELEDFLHNWNHRSIAFKKLEIWLWGK